MGIQKTWLWDNSPLRCWCCSDRRLSVMVSLERSTSPAFVSTCFHGLASPVVARRHGAWIWLTIIKLAQTSKRYPCSSELNPGPSLCLWRISSFDGWLKARCRVIVRGVGKPQKQQHGGLFVSRRQLMLAMQTHIKCLKLNMMPLL